MRRPATLTRLLHPVYPLAPSHLSRSKFHPSPMTPATNSTVQEIVKRKPRLLWLQCVIHVRRDHVRRVCFQQDSLVVIGRHLLEELGSVEVRCVADDADVEIGEVLEEAEAKGGGVGETVNVDLSRIVSTVATEGGKDVPDGLWVRSPS